MKRVAVALAALGTLLVGADASAAKTRLAVVELWSPPNLAGIAAKLTQDIVDAAAREPETSVLGPFEVEKAVGQEALKNLQACNGKPACIAQWAFALNADRLVVGMLDRNETSYLVKLFLVDLKAKTVVATIDRSVLIASRRLQSDIASAVPGMLRGKAEAKGRLTITTTSPNATVFFDGEIAGRTPYIIESKPGKHTLKVTKDGYLPVERFVNVNEGGADEVALVMTPIPGAKIEDDVPQLGKKAEDEGPTYKVPVATWITGGVAVVSAGVGTYFAVVSNTAGSNAGTGPIYNITRADAVKAKRNAIVADVLFGVSGAAAVTAILCGIFVREEVARPGPRDSAAQPPQTSIAPIPGGAAITLSGSF